MILQHYSCELFSAGCIKSVARQLNVSVVQRLNDKRTAIHEKIIEAREHKLGIPLDSEQYLAASKHGKTYLTTVDFQDYKFFGTHRILDQNIS
jgi:hypothetical protein